MPQEAEQLIQSVIDQPSVKPSEHTLLCLFLAVSSQDHAGRAKAFTALAVLFQHHTPQTCDALRVVLEDSFLLSTESHRVCDGLKVISAILLLSPPHALHLIRSDGFLSRLAASVIDLLSLDAPSSKKLPNDVDLNHSFSEFIALALNHKLVREIIQADWPGCVTWLTQISTSTSSLVSLSARCAASLALIKLKLTHDFEQKIADLPSLTGLTQVVLNGFLANDKLIRSTSVEALALVSHKSSARKILMSQSETFLRLVKTQLAINNKKETLDVDGTIQSDTSIEYGIATILANLSAYKIVKSEEDQAADQLKKLAQQKNKGSQGPDEEKDNKEIDDEAVFEWIQSTLNLNKDLMDTVAWLVRSESKQVKRTTGTLILNLVERQQLRGIVLQCGGARMLMRIIATLTISEHHKLQPEPSDTSPITSTATKDQGSTHQFNLDPCDLHIIQALAKLLITTNPLLIFGPSTESPILLSTIKPLVTLFIHPSSTLLQTFEALMALTNLSSLGGKIPVMIAESDRVLNRLEECMIGVRTAENNLICRASTELICNLSSSQSVLDYFSLQKTSSIARLHLLIALSSSEDLPTALAASGSLAILTENSKQISKTILTEKKLAESLSRVIIETIEEEGEGRSKMGVQFRLISLLINLLEVEITTTTSSNLSLSSSSVFNPKLIDCLNKFVKDSDLHRHDSSDPQLVSLLELTKSLLQSINESISP